MKKVVSEDNEVADTFFFETLVENLGIDSKYMSEEPVSNESVTDIIKKFQNHSFMIKIKKNHHRHFRFLAAELKDVNREIDSLDACKAIQQNDIPVKIIKVNRDFFSEFIMHNFIKDISTERCLGILKTAVVKPVLRKNLELIKKITDLPAFSLSSLTFLKDCFLSN